MIDFLRGKLVKKDPTHVLIDVNGVGYKVNISLATYSEIKDKEDITLPTYLHIKEDGHTLFGFSRESEKNMFLLLLSINGVGPSTALMVQSSLTAAELTQAILTENVPVIKGVKGIGAKTAQRIILELKDKIGKIDSVDLPEYSGGEYNTMKAEALSALTTLGINKKVAEKHIENLINSDSGELSLEEIIKAVLKKA